MPQACRYAILAMLLLMGVAVQAADLGQGNVTSGTYTVPAHVTAIKVEVWGGGGGGGFSSNGGQTTGGGGGGGYARTDVLPVTPGASITITVGGGGSGGSGTNAGGASTVVYGGTTIRANGGGGAANNNTSGAAGGTASGGANANYTGGTGGNGRGNGGLAYSSGGGGAAAGSNGNGANGGNANSEIISTGGAGGTGTGGGGNGGNGTSGGGEGSDGTAPGGGGGGGKNPQWGSDKNGGTGGAGRVTITYVCYTVALSSTTTTSTVCQNATGATANVTFTGKGGTAATDNISGSYTVSYTVLNTNGTTYATGSKTVTAAGGTGTLTGIAVPTTTAGNVLIRITNIASSCGGNNDITANNEATVVVKPLPAAPGLTPTEVDICGGTQSTLTATGTYTSPTYTWYKDGAQFGAPSANPGTTITQPGTYGVTVTVNGCASTPRTERAYMFKQQAVAANIKRDTASVCETADSTTLSAAVAAVVSPSIVNPQFKWYRSQTSTEVLGTGATFTTGPLVSTTPTFSDTIFYVSVSGDNYCENQPGSRQVKNVRVYKMHTLDVVPTDGVYEVCNNSTISLTANVTGYIAWTGWYNKDGNPGTGQYSPGWFDNTGALRTVEYTPQASEADTRIKLFARVQNAGCGYIADTIYLDVLPRPTQASLEIISQPVGFQNVCEDTTYQVKIKSTSTGRLTNIKLAMRDITAAEITIEEDATVLKDGVESTISGTSLISGYGVQWEIDTLHGGDSLLLTVTARADCGSYDGAEFTFDLESENMCGAPVTAVSATTDMFRLAQDNSNRNTYWMTSTFYDKNHVQISKVTNATGDTIIWRLSADFAQDTGYKQPTDSVAEHINVMVPNGLSVVLGSYNPVQNAPPVGAWVYEQQPDGINLTAPIPHDLTDADGPMIAEFMFTATGADCKLYEFYADIGYTFETDCGGKTCKFNSTQGEVYPSPTLEVERYRLEFDRPVTGMVDAGLWSGIMSVKANTQFYEGDTIYVNFFTDLNNNSKVDVGEPHVFHHIYITENVSAGSVFIDTCEGVPVVSGKQLVARVVGGSICDTLMVPIATVAGVDTVCQSDTTIYYTSEGMSGYKWGVDAISGATPLRIPLDGYSDYSQTPSVARIVWRASGIYNIWTQYTVPSLSQELGKAYFPTFVHSQARATFPRGKEFSLCAGTSIKIPIDTTDADAILWQGFTNAAGTATGQTSDTLSYTSYLRTTDTTFYVYVTVSDADLFCGDFTDSVKITVRAKPEFTYGDTTVCDVLDITNLQLVAGSTSGLTFTYWNSNNESVTDTAYKIAQSDTYRIVGTNASLCTDTSEVDVTINTTPVLTLAPQANSICSGVEVPAPTTFSSTVANTIYNITSSVTVGAGNITGNTDTVRGAAALVDTLYNSGTVNGEVTYKITPQAAGCFGESRSYFITVKPIPVLTLTSSFDTVCSGTLVDDPGLSSNISGTTYNISSSTSDVSSVTSSVTGQYAFVNDRPVYAGTGVGKVSYFITPVAAQCAGDSLEYEVVVNPLPTGEVSAVADSICQDDDVALTFTFTGTAPWDISYGIFELDDPQNPTIITQDAIDNQPYQVTVGPVTKDTDYVLLQVEDANGCVIRYDYDTGAPTP